MKPFWLLHKPTKLVVYPIRCGVFALAVHRPILVRLLHGAIKPAAIATQSTTAAQQKVLQNTKHLNKAAPKHVHAQSFTSYKYSF